MCVCVGEHARGRDLLPGSSTGVRSSYLVADQPRPLHNLSTKHRPLAYLGPVATPNHSRSFHGYAWRPGTSQGTTTQAQDPTHTHAQAHAQNTNTDTHAHTHTPTATPQRQSYKFEPRVSPTRGLGLPRLGRPSSGKPLATLPLPKGTWLRGLRRQRLQKLDTGPVEQRGTPPARRPKKKQASLNTTLTTPSMRRYAGKVRNT